jgi:hypothetical protein
VERSPRRRPTRTTRHRALGGSALAAGVVLLTALTVVGTPAVAAYEPHETPGRLTLDGRDWLVPLLAGAAVLLALAMIIAMLSRIGGKKKPLTREDTRSH